MSDGWDEITVERRSTDIHALADRIDRHIKDLGLVREEVRRVEQLISETIQNGGPKESDDLGEAAERLEKRVGKWIDQIARGFAAIKSEVHKNRAAEDREGPVEHCKVFLLDDRVLFRKGLRKIFEGKPGYSIVGEAPDLEQAMTAMEKAKPDLIVVHVCPEEAGQLEFAGSIKSTYPSLKVLVLTERGDGEFFVRLIRSGADAYLIDDCTEQSLFHAVGKVLKGETYLSPRISEALLTEWRKDRVQEEKPLLTRREEEILRMVAAGKSSRVIGQELFISAHTVDRHRANIMGKLNIRKAVDLVKYAISRGLIPPDGRTRRED